MPRKRALLSAFIYAAVCMPAFASYVYCDPEATVMGPSTYFHVGEEALRTYVILERYVKGSCPADVSPEDLLGAVKCLGDVAYDPIREKASQAEKDDLYARLKNAHRAGDPDILSAMSRVVFARENFANAHVDEKDRASHCLTYAYRTLKLFLSNTIDEDLVPGEGMMGRYFFKQSSSDHWRGYLWQ